MHHFPPVAELEHLVGQTLSQICLGPYQTLFQFDRTTIVSELGVEQVDPDGTLWRHKCVLSEGGPILLHRLVSKAVIEIHRDDLRLTLTFENGATLSILSDLGPYEAGQITSDGSFIVF